MTQQRGNQRWAEEPFAELGYVRNEMAAGLRKKNSHTVGILTASGRNQYYSMLAQVIDSTLREYGYYAVVSDMLKDRAGMGESEEQSLRLLFEQRPAAIVATYAFEDHRIVPCAGCFCGFPFGSGWRMAFCRKRQSTGGKNRRRLLGEFGAQEYCGGLLSVFLAYLQGSYHRSS